MCPVCEASVDLSVDCSQCSKRQHVLWDDPVRKLIEYLRQSRPFADKTIVLSHNSRVWRPVSAETLFGIEMDAKIDHGWKKNSLHDCRTFTLFGFAKFHA
jgi:hypothetical protein